MNRNRMWIAVVSLATIVAVLGCNKKDASTRQAPATGAASGEAAPAPGGEVHLAGTLGCGHCTFHVTSDCAAVVKTSAGDVYVLDGVDEKSPLWEKRLEGELQIAVVGTVVGDAPVKHFAMTSFELK